MTVARSPLLLTAVAHAERVLAACPRQTQTLNEHADAEGSSHEHVIAGARCLTSMRHPSGTV